MLMKKKIFAILCCLSVLVFSASAQSGKRVAVGITVGPSIEWMSPKTENYNGAGTIAGLRYGVPVDINFTADEYYYFTTGVMFSHAGGKLNFTTYSPEDDTRLVDMTRKYTSIYLSIPTGIKLKTPNFGNLVFVGNFGFYHGFNLSSKKVDSYIDGNLSSGKGKKGPYEEAAIFKESIYVGLGADYLIMDNFKANLMINYSYTFTNYFTKKSLTYDNNREKANLGSVEFILGFFF